MTSKQLSIRRPLAKTPAILYRVDFSKDWIKGRWGFTDRLFTQLKGRRYPSEVAIAWVVTYHGTPAALGQVLMRELNIQPKDFQHYGPIFEMRQLDDESAKRLRQSRALGALPAP